MSLCIFFLLDYIHPLASAVSFLNHLMCPKINFPCMSCDGVPLVNSSIFQKDCAHENCADCARFATSENCVLNCPTIFNNEQIYRWKEYQEHSELDNGKKIRELRPKASNVDGFKEKFFQTLTKYKKHYFNYRWLNLCRKIDVLTLDGCTLYIQTDYSAQPVLDSQDKGNLSFAIGIVLIISLIILSCSCLSGNSVGHGVCVLGCWVVLHSPRPASYVARDGEEVSYVYYECDHVRVVTPSTGKGKDQDWFLHCKVFEKLIGHYMTTSVPNLEKVIVWTDGAITQYKNRQNFFWLAQAFDIFDVKIIHRFGATAQFKGVHDKIGQAAKSIVR